MIEVEKYRRLYAEFPQYRMAVPQLRRLWSLVSGSSYSSWLDVGCGRGETRDQADAIDCEWYGWDPAFGGTMLPDLPFEDRSYDLVTCIDVMEHVLREDWKESVEAIARVSASDVIFCIDSEPDVCGELIGETLHISLEPEDEIERLLGLWMPGFAVANKGAGWFVCSR